MSRAQLPLAPKVGEVKPEDEKYLSWSGTHGYYQRNNLKSQAFKTDKMLCPAFTFEDIVLNRTVNSRMMSRNKSLVEFKGSRTGAAKTLSKSNSIESFVDFKDCQQLLRERGSHEQFRQSFHRFLRDVPKVPGSEVVDIHQIALMVQDCLGEKTPDFIVYKFRELCYGCAINNEVYWNDFCDVIDKVVASIDSENARHTEKAPLLLLMTRKRTVDEKLGALGDTSSTYRDNFSTEQEILYKPAPDRSFDYERPLVPVGENLNKAARILSSGTTKITDHTPGFRGHIPANMRNERKMEHGLGKTPHAVYNNLILSQRGMGCVLGYTGHVPNETFFPRTERMTACDPRTSNGAAYGTSSRLCL